MRLERLLAVVVAAAIALGPLLPAAAAAQTRTPLERRVKAAFLYKFTGYVDWPATAFRAPHAPLLIGVVGDPLLATEIARLCEGRTAGTRPIAVRALEGLAGAGEVHVLFIPRHHAALLAEARARGPRPVLIVTESEGALAAGSTINFNLVDGRVRFEISLPAADRAGLSLSARLLAVAQTVKT